MASSSGNMKKRLVGPLAFVGIVAITMLPTSGAMTTCPGFPGYCSESFPGQTCVVVCAKGRNNVPLCQEDGTWTDVPRCIEHEPGKDEQIPGFCPGISGYCSEGYLGQKCAFPCSRGPAIDSVCSIDGTWDPYPTCLGDVRESQLGCNPCPGPDGAKVNRPLPTRRKSDPFSPNNSVRNTGSVPTFAGSTSFSAMSSRQQPLTDARRAGTKATAAASQSQFFQPNGQPRSKQQGQQQISKEIQHSLHKGLAFANSLWGDRGTQRQPSTSSQPRFMTPAGIKLQQQQPRQHQQPARHQPARQQPARQQPPRQQQQPRQQPQQQSQLPLNTAFSKSFADFAASLSRGDKSPRIGSRAPAQQPSLFPAQQQPQQQKTPRPTAKVVHFQSIPTSRARNQARLPEAAVRQPQQPVTSAPSQRRRQPVQAPRQLPQVPRQLPQVPRQPVQAPRQEARQPVPAPRQPVQVPRQEPRQQAAQPRRSQQQGDAPPNPFKVDFANFDASLAHREEPAAPAPVPRRRPPPPPQRRGDEPPNPFKVDFASFDPSLSHSAPKTEREPVPLSEATFVVGEGGRVSGSVRGEGNEILDGNFFGPYQSVNLGQSFNPATANLPVFDAIPPEGEGPPPPTATRQSHGPFQVVNLG